MSTMQQTVLAVVYFFVCLYIPMDRTVASIEYDGFVSRGFEILLFWTLFCHIILPLIGLPQWAPLMMLWNGYIILPFQTLLGIAVTAHCCFHGYHLLASASAGLLLGYVSIDAYKAEFEVIKKEFQDARDVMAELATSSTEGAFLVAGPLSSMTPALKQGCLTACLPPLEL